MQTRTINRSTLHRGDCREVLKRLRANSVHSVVTDPPYGLSFMGHGWDHGVPGEEFWRDVLRVAKPGAFLLAFGGTRTFHRLACAIEDAGFELRDCIMWVYGSGFPKSHDVSKAIDKENGDWRGRCGAVKIADQPAKGTEYERNGKGTPIAAAAAAAAWDGWGTALKPAWEPIIVARKSLEGTVAENVQRHRAGGMNIDASRIGFVSEGDQAAAAAAQRACRDQNENRTAYGEFNDGPASLGPYLAGMNKGRWPANVIHDGSEHVLRLFPHTSSRQAKRDQPKRDEDNAIYGHGLGTISVKNTHGDSGSAARFFYCAKAGKKERGEGNVHPTVKPLALMRYLVRLVTPPRGVCLDPFLGSGSTCVAASALGFRSIGIELSPAYFRTARRRVQRAERIREEQPVSSRAA